ncbi:repressor protein [Ophiostoma piceae UAMH 11346]|uniref:Repressor protein n=1 Tax=Ophiostoma piceae (strain UAMH 11346) TaxID=1262450 RepID=S3D8T3_OPHP1|nr:repressor protein [Ophiostoma piceae UAMH 11346]
MASVTAETPITVPPANKRMFEHDASIVLVGCRGAGKRTLGFIGAMHMRRRLVTDDHYFEQVTGVSRAQFLSRHGIGAFARRNAEVFRQMLEVNRTRCIIECGMSSLTEDAHNVLRVYSESHPVIYVHRERDNVLPFLDDAGADQLLTADQAHRQCSNLEYFNLNDPFSGQPSFSGSITAESAGSSTGSSSPWDHSQANGSHNTPSSSNGGAGSLQSPSSNRPPAASPSRLFYAKEDFTRFLDLLQEPPWRRQWSESPFALNALPPEFRAYSFNLRLRLSYLLDMDVEWDELEASGDCVEFIVDHWPEDMFNVIARQIALIRRNLVLPIIYTVEETPREERNRPQEERDRMDKELLELGLRLNVEYLSLDLQRNNELVEHILARRGRVSIVGDFIFPGLTVPQWSAYVHVQNYERAKNLGCNVVRVVRFCTGGSPAEEPLKYKAKVAQVVPDPRPPLIAYDYSLLGARLPMQDNIFNPVKPESVPNRRDHMAVVSTLKTATAVLFQMGKLDPLQFYTIGSNIAYSITPAIHSTGFNYLGMAHTFQISQQTTLDGLHRLFLSTSSSGNRNFGGATLAAPFKVAIRPYLQLESQHASALGAVNVILPLRGQTGAVVDHVKTRNRAGICNEFYGDNTDWSSIHRCLQRALSPRNTVKPSRTTGLVIGAGGMARAAIYALIRMGCRHIFIYNRTPQHARDVAKHFNDWAQSQSQSHSHNNGAANGTAAGSSASTHVHTLCHILSSRTDPWPIEYQPPTMVVSCVPAINMDGSPAAEFEMPRQWLTSPTGGVVVELAYEPLITPLVAQMQTIRDTVSPTWVVVDGLEVVSEMAIESFELMTGRMAPKRKMRDVCRQAWAVQQQNQQQQHRRRLEELRRARGGGSTVGTASTVLSTPSPFSAAATPDSSLHSGL